ncbi:MAG: hypothetical protein HOH43_11420 [Candidatus Latescibacteria bacterium]|jgi:hypothetical protein|nr:hypothetical protein [Candidatus Latescibacterota bacterium]
MIKHSVPKPMLPLRRLMRLPDLARKCCWSFLLLLSWPTLCSGAFDRFMVGARPTGLGGAFVGLADDANAAWSNAAGLGFLSHSEISTLFSRPFGLRELQNLQLVAVIPSRYGGAGVVFNTYGSKMYRETVMGISAGRRVLSALSLGVGARILSLSIAGYGSTHLFDWQGSVFIQLPAAVKAGLVIEGLNSPRFEVGKNRVPRTVHAGLSKKTDRVMLSAQIDISGIAPNSYRVGQEFSISPQLYVRAGISTAPSVFYAGLGVRKEHLHVSYSIASHPTLGFTHLISFSIGLTEEREG